jgi:hypothetical protein
MKRALALSVCLLGVVLLAGCASHRLAKYQTFAEAGQAYADAMIDLTEEAGNAAIDADSATLVVQRDDLSRENRTANILAQTEELQGYLSAMSDLRQHTYLLRRYFTYLARLGESDAPSAIGVEMANAVTSMQKMGSRMQNATIGDTTVSGFMQEAVSLFIGEHRVRVLEEELNKHGPALERELEIQRAFLKALSVEMQADLEAILNYKTFSEVDGPYVEDGSLPRSWMDDRRELLTTYVSLASAENAASAASELKQAFLALVENKITFADFGDLFDSITAVYDLVELVQDTDE